MQTERIHFRLLHMHCCGALLCWVNPRLPNHCPECGKFAFPDVRGWITFEDLHATLQHRNLD